MKIKTTSFVSSAFAALALFLPAAALGQGQLTPPGPAFSYPSERALNSSGNPIPSMKTLMHIDAGEHIPSRDTTKTNLNGSLGYYHLNAPGRYYLTENLDKNIVIAADNVTLDLGGFTVVYTGAGTGPTAINALGLVNYRSTKVLNGRISGAWLNGIMLGDDSVVIGVDVAWPTQNAYGIKVGNDSLVSECRVRGGWMSGGPGGAGPIAGVFCGFGSVIATCSATGIYGIGLQVDATGRVVDSTVNDVAGCGIVTNHNGSVSGCAVSGCGSTGFDLGMGSSLANSSTKDNGDPGVHVRNGCTLTNVTSRDNRDHGFYSEAWTVMDPTYNKNATNFIQCSAQGNEGDGFVVTFNCLFTDCTADDNGSDNVGGPSLGDGFKFSDHCRLTNCVASNNLRSGFYGNNGNTIDGCTATGNARYGVEVASDQNIVTRNTFRTNTLATIQPAPGSGGLAPLQTPNTPGVTPFANFGL